MCLIISEGIYIFIFWVKTQDGNKNVLAKDIL